MNAYTVVHLALAGFCALLGVGYLAMFAAARQRAHLWFGLSFLGFVSLLVGLAGAASSAHHSLGAQTPWLLLAGSSGTWCWCPLWFAGWASVDQPLTRSRRAIGWGFLVLGLLRFSEVLWRARGEDPFGPTTTWEFHQNRLGSWTVAPSWLASLTVAGLFIYLAVRYPSRRSGLLLLIAGLPSFVLIGREVAIATGLIQGPSLFGITALLLVLFSSVGTAMDYARFARDRSNGLARYRLLRPLGRGGMGEL